VNGFSSLIVMPDIEPVSRIKWVFFILHLYETSSLIVIPAKAGIQYKIDIVPFFSGPRPAPG
jgi:hypothetical protein